MIQIVTEVINSRISFRFMAIFLFVINGFAIRTNPFKRLTYSQNIGSNPWAYAKVSRGLWLSRNQQYNCRELPTDNTALADYWSSCISIG
jgi:hypothetical protein